MWLRALLAGACLTGLLAACALVDPVDQRYDTVGRSLSKARDQAIFLNLVRASHDYPLSFTAIGNVTPTMTNTSAFALPAFSIGPPNCLLASATPTSRPITCSYATGVPGAAVGFGNTTASNTTAISTNFSVSTQETSAFYLGFLKPIDLQTLDYFIRQGYPRELLFWLFMDSFEFGPPGPYAIGYQYTPPDSYGCPKEDPLKICFREWILAAVLSGLTVEERTIQKAEAGGAAGKRPAAGDKTGGAGGKGETIVVARFCFNKVLARQAENQIDKDVVNELRTKYFGTRLETGVSPLCGDPSWNPEQQASQPQPDTFNFKVEGKQFRVVPRSAYGVFEFLGTLIKMETQQVPPSDNAFPVGFPSGRIATESAPPTLLTTHGEDLITVLQQNAPDCFAHTWFFDGDYCVPESATNTKRIFGLLAQLIAIQTAASDLSITPLVRIIE